MTTNPYDAPTSNIRNTIVDEETYQCLLDSDGVSRKQLNIACLLGLFTFGWLLSTAFELLGKKKLGYIYWGVLIGLPVAGSAAGIDRIYSIVGTSIIYIFGWFQANKLLTTYHEYAAEKIAEFDKVPEQSQSNEIRYEKALLQRNVLGNNQLAGQTLSSLNADDFCEPKQLFKIGEMLYKGGIYQESVVFLMRARKHSKDQDLSDRIEASLSKAKKKHQKSFG
tara:strand:- start:209 stop:877 length:669 start_codon:yes stop_codon:yes gene_type:complete